MSTDDSSDEAQENPLFDLVKGVRRAAKVAAVGTDTIKKWETHGLPRYEPPHANGSYYSREDLRDFIKKFRVVTGGN